MSSENKRTHSKIGFVLRLLGMSALLGGLLAYAILMRRMQSGTPGAPGPFGTATPLLVAASITNIGAVVLMIGLAAMREDRAAYRIAGILLAVLLVTLDMPALDALTSPGTAKMIALVMGALFLIVPWVLPRPRRKE